MHVSINILTWNDRRYLPELFGSIRQQTHGDVTVRLLDNGSSDGETVPYILQEEPRWLAARQTKNIGFAGGHNHLVKIALDRYVGDRADHAVLIANADMIWDSALIAELVKALEEHPEIDAVQPKVLRAYSERGDGDADTVKSDILDTTGMAVHRGWRCVDRGAGEMDSTQYDSQTDILAPTGTIFLIRASALQDVLIEGEFFDGAFFSYREDCDFAFRFRRAGHRTLFVPSARAHHYRGMFGAEKRSLWKRLTDRKTQRPFFAALSTRNQLFVLLKNLSILEVFRSFPWIFFQEGGRVLYGFLFEKETRRVLLRSPLLIPSMLRKRAATQALARVPFSDLRAYVR